MIKYKLKIDCLVDDVGEKFYTIVKVYFGFMKCPIYITTLGSFSIPAFTSYKEANEFLQHNEDKL